jgi:hypothetical protein
MRILRSQVSLGVCIRRGNARGKDKEPKGREKYLWADERVELWKKGKLFPEERFAQLIAADKGFCAAITVEEILDFAVLVNLLRGTNRRAGKNL